MPKVKAKIQIFSWISGEVLYESDKPTLKEAVVDANLRGANLYDADLRGANLYDADLRGAKSLEGLPRDFINQCSRDMLFVFMHLKGELPGLRQALVDGRINGTQYEGDCACLIGTLAKLDGGLQEVCSAIPYYDRGLENPGEQWFWNIREGDTPKNSVFAKHAVDLIDQVIGKPKRTKKIKGADRG